MRPRRSDALADRGGSEHSIAAKRCGGKGEVIVRVAPPRSGRRRPAPPARERAGAGAIRPMARWRVGL